MILKLIVKITLYLTYPITIQRYKKRHKDQKTQSQSDKEREKDSPGGLAERHRWKRLRWHRLGRQNRRCDEDDAVDDVAVADDVVVVVAVVDDDERL